MTTTEVIFYGGPLDGARENLDDELEKYKVVIAGGVRITDPNAPGIYPGGIRNHHYTRLGTTGNVFVYAGESSTE